MARPKLSPDDRLSERVVTYVKRSDYLRAVDRANAAGLSLAEYARKQFVSGRVVIKKYRQLDHASFNQVRRIGVNLWTLTSIAIRKDIVPPGLSECCALVEKILTENLHEPPRR